MAQPLEKASQLVRDINAMIPFPRDGARIEAIEREVALIEKNGFVFQAKQLQGMLAGIRGDAEGVRTKFKAALCVSGNNIVVRKNYAQALANLHCLREAVEQIDTAVEQSPDDIDALTMATTIHEHAYDPAGADQMIERIAKLGKIDCILKKTRQGIEAKHQMLANSGASWQEVAERIELAGKIIRSLGLSSPSLTETSMDDSFLLEFTIVGSPKTAALTEAAIHQAIAEQPFSPADRMVAFACLPL